MNILCESKQNIGILGVLELVGTAVSLAIIPFLADRIGRKIPLILTFVL